MMLLNNPNLMQAAVQMGYNSNFQNMDENEGMQNNQFNRMLNMNSGNMNYNNMYSQNQMQQFNSSQGNNFGFNP